MPSPLVVQFVALIVTAACTVALCKRLGLSPMIGYLLAGLIIGPHGSGLLAPNEGTEFLSELGIVLLMFMIGLDFSLPKMIRARRTMFGAGTAQVGLTTAVVAAAAMLSLGVDWRAALLLGGVVAMSSTALVLKQLSDQGELHTQHGRLAAAILLFQDLATLPFLVLVTPSPGEESGALILLRRFAVAAVLLAAITTLSGPLCRNLLAWVARMRSAEVSLLCSLALACGTAFIAHISGLPPGFGAFLAGMVLAECDLRHQIEDDIRPFRDVFVGFFFVTVGMQINPLIIAAAPGAVLGWTAVFVVGKALLIALLLLVLRYPAEVAARAAVILAHGGEFGLLLLTAAMRAGSIPSAMGQSMLFALIFTMGVALLSIQRNDRVARLVAGRRPTSDGRREEESVAEAARDLDQHVILCGCGRVGRLVAVVLEAARLPYIAIESDFSRFREAKRLGHHVVFGDASRAGILARAGLQSARVIVVTFGEVRVIERLLHHGRSRQPELLALISVDDDREVARVAAAGATVVFAENLAAGLELGAETLHLHGLSRDDAAGVITEARAALCAALQRDGSELSVSPVHGSAERRRARH